MSVKQEYSYIMKHFDIIQLVFQLLMLPPRKCKVPLTYRDLQ